MTESQKIKIGAILSYVQMGVSVLIGLLYTPIMIARLGQNEYGLYNTVSSTISLVGILSLGFNASYIRYYSKYKINDDKDALYRLNGLFVGIFVFLGGIALACGLFLSNNLYLIFDKGLSSHEIDEAKIMLIILSLYLAESFPASVLQDIITASEEFVVLKGISILKTVLGPLVNIPLLFLGYKSMALVITTVAIGIFVDCIYLYYVVTVLKQRFIFGLVEKAMLLDLFGFTFFIAINIIVNHVNWDIDKIILGRFKGTAEVAIYSAGYTLYQFYQMISTSISSMFNPRIFTICNRYADDAHERDYRLTELFVKVGRIQFMLISYICIGMIFLGKMFVYLWLGRLYSKAYYVALLLMIPATVPLMQNVGIDIQRALNKHKFRSIAYLIMALINIVISIFLGRIYGAIGVSIGTAISLVIANGIIINVYYQKACGIDILLFWKEIIEMSRGLMPCIIVMILLNFFVKNNSWVMLITLGIVYSIIYIISVYLISLNEFEKNLFTSPIAKIIEMIKKRY